MTKVYVASLLSGQVVGVYTDMGVAKNRVVDAMCADSSRYKEYYLEKNTLGVVHKETYNKIGFITVCNLKSTLV